MQRVTDPIFLSILGYREDGEWIALALEMDLRGYGSTFDDALGELLASVEAQISFALQRKEPDLIWHPAEPEYFSLFERVRKERFNQRMLGQPPAESEYEVRIEFPDPQVIAKKASAFRPHI